jgi:hypothetical protein
MSNARPKQKNLWKQRIVDSKRGRQAFTPALPERVCNPIYMQPDGLSPNGGEDPDQVGPWVQAHLSTDQIRWLNNQGSSVSQGDLLRNALAEWVVRHPEDWFKGTRFTDALQAALTEFIDRHKDEFLALD